MNKMLKSRKQMKDNSVLCLVAQLCPTLCDPMNCSPPGSSVHGDSPGKNIWMGCHALLQGIFLTQGLNPGLPHWRWILYHLSHQGSPWTGVGRLSLLQEILPTQELNQGLLRCRRILYQLSLQGSPKLTSVGLRALSWAAGWLSSRQSPASARGCGLNPWVTKTPWRRKREPTLVFLLGKSHGGGSWQAIQSTVSHSWTKLSN